MNYSDVDSDISLECVSSFEGYESEGNDDTSARPYMLEPAATDEEDRGEAVRESNQGEERLGKTRWCDCGHFQAMPTAVECGCCQEKSAVKQKMEELGDIQFECITSIQVSRRSVSESLPCRQPTTTTARTMGQQNYMERRSIENTDSQRIDSLFAGAGDFQVAFPSCAASKIRARFSSQEFAGFEYPKLD